MHAASKRPDARRSPSDCEIRPEDCTEMAARVLRPDVPLGDSWGIGSTRSLLARYVRLNGSTSPDIGHVNLVPPPNQHLSTPPPHRTPTAPPLQRGFARSLAVPASLWRGTVEMERSLSDDWQEGSAEEYNGDGAGLAPIMIGSARSLPKRRQRQVQRPFQPTPPGPPGRLSGSLREPRSEASPDPS